jgi:hypothetical protein
MGNDNYEDIYNQYLNKGIEQAKVENVNNSGNEKEEIVAVRKNDNGNIIAIQTSSERELDYVTALQEAKNGHLANVDVFHKYGRDILRSEPDGIKENNLDNLPSF